MTSGLQPAIARIAFVLAVLQKAAF